MEEIVRGVFVEDALAEAARNYAKEQEANCSKTLCYLNFVNEFIESNITKDEDTESEEGDKRIGRIGPNLVRFDISAHQGLFILTPDRLSVIAQSNFSTIRANTGVYKGKWMYEVQLGSKGAMQVGWGTTQCKFNQDSGVGDTANSYAYDGNRVRKWNVTTHKYGEPWLTRDIIGCAIDMDEGTIDFYRNGRHLGRAFENVPMGPGIAYFPTVSLSSTENLTANFGSTPLRYPVEGYQPLQEAPKTQVDQATILFTWFSRLIEMLESLSTQKRNTLPEDEGISVQGFLMCIAGSILKHIGPLLTVPYITEAVFLPFMQQLANLNEDTIKTSRYTENSKLLVCLDLLWTFLEKDEMKACLESTVLYLLSAFRHVSLLLEYLDQCKSLILFTKICQHVVTRQYLLQYLLFDRVRFTGFVHVKSLDEGGLAHVVGKVWWDTNPVDSSVDVNKESYFAACERLKSAISDVEALQVELLVTLLNNSDGTERRPASRTIFLRKFKRFVEENIITSRTPLPIALCCFYRLLAAFKILWDTEIGTSPVYIPCRMFYDASISYAGIDRLGGLLSHLNKTFKNELIHHLGPDHEVILAMEQTQDAAPGSAFPTTGIRMADLPVVNRSAFARMNPASQESSILSSRDLERLGYFPYSGEDRTLLRTGPADPAVSLLELLDSIILFYNVAAKEQLSKVGSLRDSMSEYITAIAETKARLELAKRTKDFESQMIQKELLQTINVFNTKLSEEARHMAWIRVAVYSEVKQKQLAWLLRVITLTLRNASEEGNMFSYVPDFYLEVLTDLCAEVKNQVHPMTFRERIPEYEEILLEAADFLCNHFLDPRIVHANSKDRVLFTLAGFVSNSVTLRALENVPRESRVRVVTNLLKPYENRAWAQSNWVLVRFWHGHGFAFRYVKTPHLSKTVGPKLLQQDTIYQPIKPCPSVIYQKHVRDVLLSNQEATTQFLNSLLNQLNWAFSEFIGMAQEIYNVSLRPERVFIESKHLKICVTCFDLTISLLRALEMISTVAPSVFNDPSQSSSENLLARLCQLLCQVLNRMSSQTSCFQYIVLLEIPDLESVDHFPILAAVVGILLALLKQDIATKALQAKEAFEVPKTTRTMLTEPSFQISSLHFLLGDTKPKSSKAKNRKPFSFSNYQGDVTKEEINRVKDMVEYLDYCRSILPDSKSLSDDDDTCTICYAFPIAAVFKPCNHRTCRSCIDRHLLNTRECFFCKATIDKVVDLSDNVLHDFSHKLGTDKS